MIYVKNILKIKIKLKNNLIMLVNFSVLSIKDDKIIFYGDINVNEEIELDFFSFKILEDKKIIISKNFKKLMVYLNEIFSIDYFEYVFFIKEKELVILNYYNSCDSEFQFLKTSKFFIFLIKNINYLFYIKINNKNCNFKYISKLLIFIFFSYFLMNLNLDKIKSEKFLFEDKFLTIKNIYFILNKISLDSKNELINYNLSQIKLKNNLKKSNKINTRVSLEKEKNNEKKKEDVDLETKYFMDL